MQSDRSGQNLDPLLDTMANVVGILVVLVAVTQLSVGDAVERIKARSGSHPVTRVEVEAAEAEREEVEDALVAARGRLAAMTPTARRPGMLLAEAAPALERLEALPERSDVASLGRAALEARLRDEAVALERIEQGVASRQERLGRIELAVSDIPEEIRPKIARLPDPRPPPAGAREIVFFCRYGRIMPLDFKGLRAALKAGITAALGQDRLADERDVPFLVNFFAKQAVGDDDFVWSFRDEGARSLFADVHWRDPGQGEGLADLRRGGSAFAAHLAGYSPRSHYARFFVWSDSFETYLEARYLAESAGFDVSWMAVDAREEVGLNLLGGPVPRVMID